MTSPDKRPAESDQEWHPQQVHHGSSQPQEWQSQPLALKSMAPNPASSPVPPGFSGGGSTSSHHHHPHAAAAADHHHNSGSTEYHRPSGEDVRSSGGALSAPPPPGFKSDADAADRTRVASSEMAQISGGRTSSFVNLAAVLGTGLAESMDDAAQADSSWKHQPQQGHSHHQQHHQQHPHAHQHQQQPPLRTSGSSASDDLRDSSFARQSRHAASRLIGASPPRVEPLGLDYNIGTTMGGAAPASLRGEGGHHEANVMHSTNPSKNNHYSNGGGGERSSASASGGGGAGPGVHTTADSDHGGMRGNFLSAAFAHHDPSSAADGGPEDLFGTPGRRAAGPLPATSRDLGVTVTEPVSDQRATNYRQPTSSGESDDGLFEALMREQQQIYCSDPQCQQQIDTAAAATAGTAGRRVSDGVLASLMQAQQDPQFYCNDPQCHQQPPPQQADALTSGERPPVAGRRTSEGVLASLMQQEQQVYCDDPQCTQQQPSQQQKQYSQYDEQQRDRNPERDTFEAEQGMRNLWLDDNASAGHVSSQQHRHNYPTDRSVGASSLGARSEGSQSTKQVSEADIRPFIWDARVPRQQQGQYDQRQQQPNSVDPSRCLAILRTANLHVPDVRSTCEAFGVLESFRSDFADRGIIFVSYYDIRSAQYAALELEAMLKRRESIRDGGSAGREIAVYYCVPLDSSSQTDESRLVLTDVPQFVNEHSLLSMLSSYGAVRSLQRQGGYYGGSSYEAEFHNVQDSKQALMELSSTQPWGPDVAVEIGMRPPIDRKRGRELLSVIGRWRHGNKSASISPTSSTGAGTFGPPQRLNHGAPIFRATDSTASPAPQVTAAPETQLVLGPDGRYSYMVVNNQAGYSRRHPQEHSVDHNQRQQIVHGPNGEIYLTTALPPHQPPSNYRHGGPPQQSRDYWSPPSAQPPQQHHHHLQYPSGPYHVVDNRERLDRISGPYYSHQVIPTHPDQHGVHHHHHPHSSNTSSASVGGDDKDNKHLVLDLDAVENGRDHRTSLMVRNIPNKYTQQMLLSEFTENALGPGTIDFFYLPIDFKNRCNRGYAFINFVDFKDILPFHQRYFGKHWSTFNSDKICDITYARIQGKAAMLKRFENSALMEKDEEYKPLVFISHGPEKGKRIPFPEAAAAANKS